MAAGSRGGSSSEVSATVKSERVAMLIDGECGTGDSGLASFSGGMNGSSGGD